MSRARSQTEPTTNQTEYNSQSGLTPSDIKALSPEPRMALYGVWPVFGPEDVDKPTEAEFKNYNNKVCEYVSGIAFLLTFLKDDAGERPGAITVIDPKKMTALQMWRAAQTLGECYRLTGSIIMPISIHSIVHHYAICCSLPSSFMYHRGWQRI